MRLTHLPVVTVTLLTISALVAIVSGLGNRLELLEKFFYSYYLEPQFVEIKQGQVWRVITPIFIHFGILHILMNSIVIWVLGRLMEPIHGKFVFTSVILITAMFSNTAQYLVSGPLFGGLSGVIYGLIGFVWAYGKFSPRYPLRLDPRFTMFIVAWFFLCWSGLLSKIGVHIANTAHTVGLFSGLICAFLMAKLPQYR